MLLLSYKLRRSVNLLGFYVLKHHLAETYAKSILIFGIYENLRSEDC